MDEGVRQEQAAEQAHDAYARIADLEAQVERLEDDVRTMLATEAALEVAEDKVERLREALKTEGEYSMLCDKQVKELREELKNTVMQRDANARAVKDLEEYHETKNREQAIEIEVLKAELERAIKGIK